MEKFQVDSMNLSGKTPKHNQRYTAIDATTEKKVIVPARFSAHSILSWSKTTTMLAL